MAESPTPDPVEGSGSQPSAAPESASGRASEPVDPRPRPQFGELAPPGWVWKPPADSHTGHQQEPMVVHKQPHASAAPKPRRDDGAQHPAGVPASPASADAARQTPAWDRPLTVALLAIGLIGVTLFVRIQAST